MSLFRFEAPLDESAEAAAALIGDIDAETLVKDYWVTEALRALSNEYRSHFVFKGAPVSPKPLVASSVSAKTSTSSSPANPMTCHLTDS